MKNFWDYLIPVRILPIIISFYIFFVPILPLSYKITGLLIYLVFMGLDLWLKPDKKFLLECVGYYGILAVAILSIPMIVNSTMYIIPIIYNLVLGLCLLFLDTNENKEQK